MATEPGSDTTLNWLEDSVSFLPSFLDDPYSSNDLNGYQWWDRGPDIGFGGGVGSINDININTNTSIVDSTSTLKPFEQSCITSDLHLCPPISSDSSKKRRNCEDITSSPSNHQRKNHGRQTNETQKANDQTVSTKKGNGSKKNANKSNNNNNNKEGRWAEQLLNPCAAAIAAGNLTRVQHLLYVLHELASPTGDANHRLAAHGLRALTQHLASLSTSSSTSSISPTITFASTEPKFFQKSLLNFYDKSPWFAFPNNIANSSIIQILTQSKDQNRTIHIVDIGVSHGVQWPTLLEALASRKSGNHTNHNSHLIRLTIVGNNQNFETPFTIGPSGDNYSSQLQIFAKTLNIFLQINKLDLSLQKLDAQAIRASPEETLIVCAQFRLHHLDHTIERSEFLKKLTLLKPKGVILSENNHQCSCLSCTDFSSSFSTRVEYLWRFLDSTSAAFKGRESEERRMMEGEAAKALVNKGEMNEVKEKWFERMREVGFVGEAIGEDAIDGGRALLRKYDGNWEMRVEVEEKERFCVGLWWKGEAVSFCSLWKLGDGDLDESGIDQSLRSTL